MTEVCDEQRAVAVCAETAASGRNCPSLTVSIRVSGAWTIATIVGEMDLQVSPLVRELVSADARHLVFDLRQVTFMDACGLELLLRSQRDAVHADGCVRLVAPSRQVRRVLRLTGANRQLSTFASVDEAISAPVPGPVIWSYDGRSRPNGAAGRVDRAGRGGPLGDPARVGPASSAGLPPRAAHA